MPFPEPFLIPDTWHWFTLAFGIMLIATFFMSLVEKKFYTLDEVERKFSMIDLEFPATPSELVEVIKNIYLLPEPAPQKVVKALRIHLLIDYILFMPSVYGGIFILSMKIGTMMSGYVGQRFFAAFAWLQVLAFILDIIENIYLWRQINRSVTASTIGVFHALQFLELLKWGIPLIVFVSSLSSLLYFWLTGQYSKESFSNMGIIALEIFLFYLAGLFSSRVKKKADSLKAG